MASFEPEGKEAGGWYWMCDDAHYGDLYQVLAMAASFRDHHGWRRPLRLVATTPRQAQVAGLFADRIDEIIVAPELRGSELDWSALREELGVASFGLNTPIPIWPIINPEIGRDLWVFVIDELRLPVTTLHRRMLHLPPDAELRHPSLNPEREQAARRLCEAAGMVQGRSVLLFTRARSVMVEAATHFADLAGAAGRGGAARLYRSLRWRTAGCWYDRSFDPVPAPAGVGRVRGLGDRCPQRGGGHRLERQLS